jgi:predicted nucleic acid-binding protein
MLVLDTNLVSELMRPEPDVRVLAWVAAQPLADFAIAAATLMEVLFGIAILPHGHRRADLDRRFDHFLAQGFTEEILRRSVVISGQAVSVADIGASSSDLAYIV